MHEKVKNNKYVYVWVDKIDNSIHTKYLNTLKEYWEYKQIILKETYIDETKSFVFEKMESIPDYNSLFRHLEGLKKQ